MDDTSERSIRRSRTIILVLGAAAVVIGSVVGVVAASTSSGHHVRPAHVAMWREVLGLCLIAVGVVIEGWALVRLDRLRDIGGFGRPLLAGLNRRERVRAVRQVYGRSPVSEHEVQWLRALATQLATQQESLRDVTTGTTTILIGAAVTSRSPWALLIFVIAAALNVATGFLSTRNSRRAAKFIQEHPVETSRPQG